MEYLGICGNQDKAFNLGLGYQHPVQGVAVVNRQPARLFSIQRGQGKGISRNSATAASRLSGTAESRRPKPDV